MATTPPILGAGLNLCVALDRRTGRSPSGALRTAGFAAVAEDAIEYMVAPIVRVTGFDTTFPHTLEHDYMRTIDRIAHAVKKVESL